MLDEIPSEGARLDLLVVSLIMILLHDSAPFRGEGRFANPLATPLQVIEEVITIPVIEDLNFEESIP